ncbi:hypothetical protein SK128_016555 [Halocaridina rubra]|uniref:GH18 domain-containing protein n=1 Tax=Halocaridina rubra TaxID=373956 RepID=A0AAN8XER8_HALRR
MKLLASLGGPHVKAETFSLVTSSVEGVANFTEGLISFVASNQLDGIEIDWRWPGQHGGRKEIDDVSTLMKVVRLALDQRVHSVSRREAEDITATFAPDSLIITEEEEDEIIKPVTDAAEVVPTAATKEITTETTTQLPEEEILTESPDNIKSYFDYIGDYFNDYFAEYFPEDYPVDYAEYYSDDYDIASTTFSPETES